MSLQIPSKAYNTLKPIVQVVLPATATLYAAVAILWGLPATTEVVGTITAVATFLGVCLGISTRNYYNSDRPYDGALNVSRTDTALVHQLEIDTPPENLKDQKSITLRVNKIDDVSASEDADNFDDFHGSA